MDTKDTNQVGFLLKKIVTDQFATIESAFIENEPINIIVGIEYGIREENKIVGCFTNFQFLIHDIPFIIIKVSCEFGIEESSWNNYIDDEKNVILFPLDFIRHLVLLTIGTARGVLHAKTENTRYNQYFLPTINLTELVKEDISFTLDTKPERVILSKSKRIKK